MASQRKLELSSPSWAQLPGPKPNWWKKIQQSSESDFSVSISNRIFSWVWQEPHWILSEIKPWTLGDNTGNYKPELLVSIATSCQEAPCRASVTRGTGMHWNPVLSPWGKLFQSRVETQKVGSVSLLGVWSRIRHTASPSLGLLICKQESNNTGLSGFLFLFSGERHFIICKVF